MIRLALAFLGISVGAVSAQGTVRAVLVTDVCGGAQVVQLSAASANSSASPCANAKEDGGAVDIAATDGAASDTGGADVVRPSVEATAPQTRGLHPAPIKTDPHKTWLAATVADCRGIVPQRVAVGTTVPVLVHHKPVDGSDPAADFCP